MREMSFYEKCQHCEHAGTHTRCCFCHDYILRSGNVIFRSSDKPIVVHDVTPKEADDE